MRMRYPAPVTMFQSSRDFAASVLNRAILSVGPAVFLFFGALIAPSQIAKAEDPVSATSGAPATAQSSAIVDPLTVGVSLPLSGFCAEYGTAVRQGFELAQKRFPLTGNLRFIYEDNRFAAAEGLSTFQKLTLNDHPDLIYLWGEGPLQSVAPVAEKKRIPLLAMSVDEVPAQGAEFVTLTINPSKEFGEKLALFIREKKWKNISLITAEDPFFEAAAKSMTEHLGTSATVTRIDSITPTSFDFRSAVTKVKRSKPDALGVFLVPGQVSAFFRLLKAANVQLPCFGTDVFESRREYDESDGSMRGAFYVNLDVPDEFRTSYSKEFGNDLQVSYAYNAFVFAAVAGVELASDTFNGSSPKNPLKQVAAFRELQNRENYPEEIRNAFQVLGSKAQGYHYAFPLVVKTVDEKSFPVVMRFPKSEVK